MNGGQPTQRRSYEVEIAGEPLPALVRPFYDSGNRR
jgi:hypothetical protein